jgi:hypothetical protein
MQVAELEPQERDSQALTCLDLRRPRPFTVYESTSLPEASVGGGGGPPSDDPASQESTLQRSDFVQQLCTASILGDSSATARTLTLLTAPLSCLQVSCSVSSRPCTLDPSKSRLYSLTQNYHNPQRRCPPTHIDLTTHPLFRDPSILNSP